MSYPVSGRHAAAAAVRTARPAFRPFWASYTSGFRAALRGYGPVTAGLPLLDGLRVADFLVGSTLVELKTGHFDDTGSLYDLVDQVLTYGLLAPVGGCPVTAVVVYLARYHVLARYPFAALLDDLAANRSTWPTPATSWRPHPRWTPTPPTRGLIAPAAASDTAGRRFSWTPTRVTKPSTRSCSIATG